MENKEKLPCPHIGVPYSEDLSRIDSYIANHIGITPTKHSSEIDFDCPPVLEAMKAQRLMANDHSTIYGTAGQEFRTVYIQELVAEVVKKYHEDCARVPEEYGAIYNGEVDKYLKVEADRTYDAIVDRLFTTPKESSPAQEYVHILKAYVNRFGLEPWQAARLTTRFIDANFRLIANQEAQRETETYPKRISLGKVLATMTESEILEKHFSIIEEQMSAGKSLEIAFNSSLPSTTKNSTDINVYVNETEMEDFRLAYHLMERPYTEKEIELANNLLENDTNLRNSLMLFQYELIEHISKYIETNPQRLAHSLEFYTEIFLSVQKADETIEFIPNPKLLKVISKNVLPAVAREMIATGANTLDPEHIRRGASQAKDLMLFQTMIGEFHTDKDGDEKVIFNGFFSQTCPAMKPFSNALIEVLPKIYYNLQQITNEQD